MKGGRAFISVFFWKERDDSVFAQKKTAHEDSLFYQKIKPFLQPFFPCKLLFLLLFPLPQQLWLPQPLPGR